MIFGQLVIGPPGSGKTTYCKAMEEFLHSLGRKVAVINVDPANDSLPYDPKVDVKDLVSVEEVMERLNMGPNGALVFCMEYLENKFDWLLENLKKYSDCYLLIDCPGQVELYTHHASVRNIFSKLKKADYSLTALHLVDSYYCSDPGKYIAVSLTSLSTMLQMEMPHINILSKCDMIENYGELHYGLDIYTETLDLSAIVTLLSEDKFFNKYKKLNEAMADVLESYGYVSYLTLSVKEKETMHKILKEADKANGYVFGVNEEERNIQAMLSCATSADFADSNVAIIREKYMSTSGDAQKDFVSLGR